MYQVEHETVPIAVILKDGTLAVQHILRIGRGSFLPSGATYVDGLTWLREVTDEGVKHNLARTFGDQVMSWKRLQKHDLPADRTFRDAWHLVGDMIVHDMQKAKSIKRDHIRHARAQAMVELDAQFTRAQGTGDKKAADLVEAKRQKWRDAPADPRIEAAKTVEELKAVTGL
jgi:hypothetical protein